MDIEDVAAVYVPPLYPLCRLVPALGWLAVVDKRAGLT